MCVGDADRAQAAPAASCDLSSGEAFKWLGGCTLRAIHAVIDQLDNPASFARNRDAYEKHGASQGTFNKWKKKLTAFVVEEADAAFVKK